MSPVERPSRPVLPSFRVLAGAALAANAPVLAYMIASARFSGGFGVAAGVMIGLAVYGSLYLFVSRGLDPFVKNIRGSGKAASGGPTFLFALLLPLKYLALAALMWLFWRVGHMSLSWFAVGFLITQISVTVAAAAHLARSPRW